MINEPTAVSLSITIVTSSSPMTAAAARPLAKQWNDSSDRKQKMVISSFVATLLSFTTGRGNQNFADSSVLHRQAISSSCSTSRKPKHANSSNEYSVKDANSRAFESATTCKNDKDMCALGPNVYRSPCNILQLFDVYVSQGKF